MTGANPDRTVRIQYRPHLIEGCLRTIGLDLKGLINQPDTTDST
ncbi:MULTISPECIES: hypothetical protein [unclassified Streptomyces]|nr:MULTISPECIES: hypothetical protein [unclassified Streptomyces]